MRKFFLRFLFLFTIFWIYFSVSSQQEALTRTWQGEQKVTQLRIEKAAVDAVRWKAETDLRIEQMETIYDNFKRVSGKPWEFLGGMPKEEYDKLVQHIEDRPARVAALKEKIRSTSEKSAQLEKELDEAMRAYSLRGSIATTITLLLGAFQAEWLNALGSTLLVYLGLLAWKLFCFYIFAPWIERRQSIQLFEGKAAAGAPGTVEHGGEQGNKLITLPLAPGQVLTVCDEDYTGGYTDADVAKLKKRTQWLFSVRYWLMSWLCGLVLMTRFENARANTETHYITVTSDDPDEYFSEQHLEEGQPIFISPSDLVAFSDGIRIRAHWRLLSPVAWSMGQVRYYSLSGRGRVIVRSDGGLTGKSVTPGCSYICKKHSIISAEQGVRLHVRRTETLMPYLFGKSDLFDLRLHGTGFFRMHNALHQPHTVSERVSHIFMESLGAFFGF